MTKSNRLPPGRLAEEYAARNGWTLLRRNIMVEGDSDVHYLELASDRYESSAGLKLLGKDLGCFSAGTGDDGGTDGIIDEYHMLRKLIDSDKDENSKVVHRVVVLLDCDKAGQSCATSLQTSRGYKLGRDVFTLRRVWPMQSNEPTVLGKNLAQGGIDVPTVIEDLLAPSLISEFGKDRPEVLTRYQDGKMGDRHYTLSTGQKSALCRYARGKAGIEHLEMLVNCLKAMRFYLGLPPDGIA